MAETGIQEEVQEQDTDVVGIAVAGRAGSPTSPLGPNCLCKYKRLQEFGVFCGDF